MNKHNLWDETPDTLTEFGPLSADIKPAGSFISRWLRKGKGEESEHSGSSSSRAGSSTSSREGSVERRLAPGTLLTPGSAERRGAGLSSRSAAACVVSAAEEGAMQEPAPSDPWKDAEETISAADNSSQSDDGSEGRTIQMLDVQMTRNLSSVLSRLGNILDRRSTTPQTYKDSDFKQYWMPDSSCKECYDCGDKFTTFRRRHHCRICGQIFCSKCCNQELPGKIIGYKGGIRVCDYCCKVVLRYAQQSVSTGEVKVFREEITRNMSASQLDLEASNVEFGLWSPLAPRPSIPKDEHAMPQQRVSVSPDLGAGATEKSAPFDLTPQSEFSSQECLLTETKILTQDSLQLRALWRQLQESDTGVEMQSHRIRLRTHQNCIVGRDLVDWLMRNDKAVKRDQAVAIGQALMYAGFLEPIGNQLPVFRDDFTLYRPGETASILESQPDLEVRPSLPEERESSEPLWLREIKSSEDSHHGTVLTGEGERAMALESERCRTASSETSDARTASSSYSSKSDGSCQELPKLSLMSRDLMEEPLPRQDSSATGLTEDFLKGTLFLSRAPLPSSDMVTCPQGWRSAEQLREENGEKLAYERLKQAHTEHLQLVTRQLLSQHTLSASWENVILNCVHQLTHFVRPDVRGEGDDLDIRKYVHIKKIAVGQKQDTAITHGLVFTKNIAHKKMRHTIANPHILLLRGAIEYQRVENKFSSLEPQILQEREFLKNHVSKITAFHPNIVVVERSVSRLAQEYLLEAGITLIFNVKQRVMERLARFTQADIVQSIDSLLSNKPNLGFCHDFHCQTYALPSKELKTVVVFGGCATHLGCTICLTGASFSELKRVKLILRFLSYVAYNSLLELCFSMDEFALPPPGSEELTQSMDGFESSMDVNPTHTDLSEPMDVGQMDGKSMMDSMDICQTGLKENMDINQMDGKDTVDNSQGLQEAMDTSSLDQKDCGLDGNKASSVSQIHEQHIDETKPNAVHFIIGEGIQASHPLPDVQIQDAEYTSLTDVMHDDETDKENAPPPPSPASVQQRLAAETTHAMQRQLSEARELTDASDPLLGYQQRQDESIFKRSHSIQLREETLTVSQQFRLLLQATLLSVSPYVKHQIPYLQSEAGERCQLRKFLPRNVYWSAQLAGEGREQRGEQRLSKGRVGEMVEQGGRHHPHHHHHPHPSHIKITEAHPFVLSEMTAPAHDVSTLTLLADFRARGGRICLRESKINGVSRDSEPSPKRKSDFLEDTLSSDPSRSAVCWEKKTDCLDIWNHQRLSVLFSSYSYRSPNHPNPCVYPWVVTMSYYGRNDITLGGFLEKFCFRESYTCPSPTCEVPMVEHIRRFVHGHGCINVLLKKLDNPVAGAQDNILLWSWCRRCKQVTPVVPISADTWNLSFAKYLDLRFHCSSFRRRGSAEPCPHSLHLDHYQYFGHRDIVASFKYANVILRELALPAVVVDLIVDPIDAQAALNTVKIVTSKGMDRFSTILEITMKLKSEMTGDSAARTISDFLTEQQSEKNLFREAATEIQIQLADILEQRVPDLDGPCLEILDSIVMLKRMISESVQRWNNRIQEFMTNQQRRSRTHKKEKELASSCDEVERANLRTSEDRALSICVVAVDPTSVSQDLKPSDDVAKPGSGNRGSSNASPKHSFHSPASDATREGPSNGKTEGEDVTDGSWFSSARRWLTSSGFTPLALPFQPSEHHLLPLPERVPVVVYDQEPSSIIAYALSSADYQVKLRDVQAWLWGTPKDGSLSSMTGRSTKEREGSGMSVDTVLETDEPDGLSLLAGSSLLTESGDKSKMSKQSSNAHIELQFSDSCAKFYCRVYFAEQFRKLRKHIFPAGEEMFIRSLCRCKPWEAKGGKSGSAFCKTDDDRFIMKQMSSMEADSFEKFGPQYFHYITKACSEKNPTALAKILGVYRIGFRNTQTNSTLKQDLLVMENLFYNRKITQKFDLKGSMRNRLVNTAGKQAEEELVLLDENLLKWSVDCPLYLRPHSKSVLRTAISNDSSFLSNNLVMDYSLLVGLDDITRELVVGIIDYIRTFTWDKKLEMVIKTNLPGQGKMPTVVSPQLYKNRFLEAMDRYFLHVPDQWNGLGRDSPEGKDPQTEEQDMEVSHSSAKR